MSSEVGLSGLARPWGRELVMCLWEAFYSLTEATPGREAFTSPQVSHS